MIGVVPLGEQQRRMPHIDLPRALEDYFAFAESTPTRHGRRFSITLPYQCGEKLDRLQWWYHVSPAQEQMFEGAGLAEFRARAIVRFRKHIQQWLDQTRQRLHGTGPIPSLGPERTDAEVIVVEVVVNG
jgi:hypothetical protein